MFGLDAWTRGKWEHNPDLDLSLLMRSVAEGGRLVPCSQILRLDGDGSRCSVPWINRVWPVTTWVHGISTRYTSDYKHLQVPTTLRPLPRCFSCSQSRLGLPGAAKDDSFKRLGAAFMSLLGWTVSSLSKARCAEVVLVLRN